MEKHQQIPNKGASLSMKKMPILMKKLIINGYFGVACTDIRVTFCTHCIFRFNCSACTQLIYRWNKGFHLQSGWHRYLMLLLTSDSLILYSVYRTFTCIHTHWNNPSSCSRYICKERLKPKLENKLRATWAPPPPCSFSNKEIQINCKHGTPHISADCLLENLIVIH